MKVQDFLIEERKNGIYVAVKFSDDTINRLLKYCNKANIPEVLKADEFHCTLSYSRKDVPDFEPKEKIKEIGVPYKFEVWPSSPNAFKKDMTYCLVLKFKSDYLQKRFDKIMSMGATYDYDKYQPHISLSYNVDKDFDVKKLPPIKELGDFEIVSEYSEELELD